MRANSLLPNPVFAPRYLNVDQATAGQIHTGAAVLSANFAAIERFDNLVAAIRGNCDRLIVDPVTHAFSYRGFLDKATFRGLPYAPDSPLQTSVLRDPARVRDFVAAVLDYELQQQADILVAPYLFVRDIDDGRLSATMRLVSEAVRLKSERQLATPLYAMVCVGALILESPVQTQDLITQFREHDVDGYLVVVENCDDRAASAELLLGLARLCRELAIDRDVVPCAIAAFGQVLTAAGTNGFSAGVGWLETFREVNLEPMAGFPGDRVHRSRFYYVPELLSYVHPDQVLEIFGDGGSDTARQYLCSCPVCASGLPTEPAQKKLHFMHRRLRELSELAAVSPGERLRHMRQRIGVALELAAVIEEEVLVRIPTEHFVRWIAVIDAIEQAGPAGGPEAPNPEELDRLIDEARRSGRGTA